MRAFVFPGQGAQTIGMGQALAEAYPSARAIFDEVDDALSEKLSDLIWNGDIAELTLTRNAQPALMATSLAAMKALETEGVDVSTASFVAGHSLGEYSALAAAGAFSVSDTARLLRVRGDAMQAAVADGDGAMAAILGLDLGAVETVAAEAADGVVCAVANENDPAQTVVSGARAAVERAEAIAAEGGHPVASVCGRCAAILYQADGAEQRICRRETGAADRGAGGDDPARYPSGPALARPLGSARRRARRGRGSGGLRAARNP